MDKVRIYHDRTGNTLTIWFHDPANEAVCEEIEDDVILIKGHGTLERRQRKLAIHWSVNVRCSLFGSHLCRAGMIGRFRDLTASLFDEA